MSSPPAISDMIQTTVSGVAESVRRAFPPMKGLVLTGSTARGEATVAVTPSGAHWLSDMEFLVVVDNRLPLGETGRRLNRLAADISAELRARDAQVEVELTPAPERYFPAAPRTLFSYELARCGRQILGGTDYLARIPAFDWREVPREEAWRLVSNRMVEWLDFLLHPRAAPAAEFYVIVKQYLDLLTSLTIFSGHYAPSYSARVAALDAVARWMRAAGLGGLVESFEEGVKVAFRFKQDPYPSFSWLWREGQADGDLVVHLRENLPGLALSIWKWQKMHLFGGISATSGNRFGTRQDIGSRLKGWLKLASSGACPATPAAVFRALRLFGRGTPRSLVYACTARLLESHPAGNPEAVRWVRDRLPALPARTPRDWNSQARQCVHLWQTCLRRSYA